MRLPRYLSIVLVGLLLIATGFSLLHWHKDWTDHGCQLCHVRHLPSLHSAFGVAYGAPIVSQEDWNREDSTEEREAPVRNTFGRSPPAPTFSTL